MRTRPGSPPFDEGSGPSARAAGLPPPAERGTTVIPDRVVARIAAQAARAAQSRRAALDALCEGPLRTAHRSTGFPDMPAETRLQFARHKPHRAE